MRSNFLTILHQHIRFSGRSDELAEKLGVGGGKQLMNQLNTGNTYHKFDAGLLLRLVDLLDTDLLAETAAVRRGGVFVRIEDGPEPGEAVRDREPLAVMRNGLNALEHLGGFLQKVQASYEDDLTFSTIESREIEVRALPLLRAVMTAVVIAREIAAREDCNE